MNTLPLFFYKFRPKFRRIQRSVEKLSNPQDFLKPNFKSFYTDFRSINIFPVLFSDPSFNHFFSIYQKSVFFLINTFTESKLTPYTDVYCFEYLFFYLNNTVALDIDKKDFILLLTSRVWNSYSDLLRFLVEFLYVNSSDLLLHKERIIAEYIAFKRFYSLVISEYGNAK